MVLRQSNFVRLKENKARYVEIFKFIFREVSPNYLTEVALHRERLLRRLP